MSHSLRAAQPRNRFPFQLSLRARLIGLVLVIGVIAAASVAVAISGLVSSRSTSRASHSTFNVMRASRDAYEGWLTDDDQSNMLASLAALGDRKQLPLMRATRTQVLQGFAQAIASLRTVIVSDPTVAPAARRTLADVEAYNVFTQGVVADALRFRGHAAVQAMAASNAPISNRVQADFNRIDAAITTRAAGLNAAVATTVSSAISLAAIIGIAGVLLAIAVTFVLMRSITRPLGEMTAAAEQIAAGDVTVEITVTGDDEIGRMANAFAGSVEYLRRVAGAAEQIAEGNLGAELEPQSERDLLGHAFGRMRVRIAGMIGQIAESSDVVGSSSEQLARTGEQAGLAVTEIAGAIGSVALGAETQVRSLAGAREQTLEVAERSNASVAEAAETAEAARATRELARDGAEAVNRATDVMRSVQAASTGISVTMRELGTMSDRIGGIVDTITAIAEQTNLLALNAAIEAARAGEQGRGFAVVAEEVRKLAEESQSAAASIGDLVGQIQSGTGRAVAVVAEGAARAEEGVATVEHAREVFVSIDAGVSDMSERIERITAAVTHIAEAGVRVQTSIEEVLAVAEASSASAEQVSATTEQTSASTQQIAASAADLSRTAAQLQSVVRQFQL